MPYELREGPKGMFRVFTQGTDRAHSNEPLPHARAVAQMRALYANEPDAAKPTASKRPMPRGGKVPQGDTVGQ